MGADNGSNEDKDSSEDKVILVWPRESIKISLGGTLDCAETVREISSHCAFPNPPARTFWRDCSLIYSPLAQDDIDKFLAASKQEKVRTNKEIYLLSGQI